MNSFDKTFSSHSSSHSSEVQLSIHDRFRLLISRCEQNSQDSAAALALLALAYSTTELRQEDYRRAHETALELETTPAGSAVGHQFPDWEWVKDFLASMSGVFPLRTRPVSGVSRPSLNRLLRIGVDVRCLEIDSTRKRGIGRYVFNLIREMSSLPGSRRIVLLGDEPPWDAHCVDELRSLPNVEYENYHHRFAANLDVLLLTDPLPVLTGRALLPYPVGDLPVATIIYDLIPLAYPQHYLASNEGVHRQYLTALRKLSRTVGCYLPISNFVGNDLHERLQIDRARIHPILGGLDQAFAGKPSAAEIEEVRSQFGIHGDYFVYAGGLDYRKNLDTLLHAFIRYRKVHEGDAKLVLVGDDFERWVRERLSVDKLRPLRQEVICTGFVTDHQLHALYGGATAFVFPSLHEGFGLPALEAMASGCPVIVSDSTSLAEIVADAGLQIDPLSPERLASAMLSLQNDRQLCADLRDRGLQRARLYRWADVAGKTVAALEQIAKSSRKLIAPSRKLRVLLQNRPDAFTARGGDTVVMNQLYRSLRDLDVEVDVAGGTPDLKDTDLVHLINLTMKTVGAQVAGNAKSQGVPLVTTTLYEDWPRYLDKSIEAARLFYHYAKSDHDQSRFDDDLRRLRNLRGSAQLVCDEVLDYAAALVTCGSSEAASLTARFPHIEDKVRQARFGVTDMSIYASASPEQICRTLKVPRFVLCCGRVETRKNQLMLLKALEDDDLAIVFAGGGFSAQPEYVNLVRNYQRKAPVYMVDRLSIRSLANLMKAAAAHVLPSWYELPGLVTLEAATCGTSVVASEWGAIEDYLPRNLIHTCRPDDPASIRDAVHEALKSEPSQELADIAKGFTIESFGTQMLNIYEEALRAGSTTKECVVQANQERNIENIFTPDQERSVMTNRKYSFDVSIIIPVYNQVHLTQRCLEAISNDKTGVSYEVVIVDNHSTDETPRLLEAIEGDVKILREPVNRGFAAACNRGARLADGRCLVFLNNDTEPLSGWLDHLVECAGSSAEVGAVGAKLLYPDGRTQHAGIAFNQEKTPYNIFQNFPSEHPAVNEQRRMQAVSAACMLIPADLFEQAGGMDEGYRNGFEDVDLCLRLHELKREVVYCPDAVVTHHEESSEGRKDHDRENLDRFLARWANNVKSDEQNYTEKFGLRLEWGEHGGRYVEVAGDQAAQADSVSNTADLIDEASKHYVAGNFENAVNVLQRVVESKMVIANEDGFEAWQTMGNCFARLNKSEEAENAYMEAVRLNENSERPYLGLGSVAMLKQNWTAAQYGFMAALAKNPEATRGRFGVGISLAAQNKHEESLVHFRSVMEAEPNNSEALFYLYRGAMESGRPELALDALESYVLEHPNDTDFLFNFSGALWKCGELSRAIEICEQILEIDPEHMQAREALEHMRKSVTEHA